VTPVVPGSEVPREHQRVAAQYFPKKRIYPGFTQSQLDKVALRLNQRPRKTWDSKLQLISFEPVLRERLNPQANHSET